MLTARGREQESGIYCQYDTCWKIVGPPELGGSTSERKLAKNWQLFDFGVYKPIKTPLTIEFRLKTILGARFLLVKYYNYFILKDLDIYIGK